jgi:predicted esterase
MSSNQLVRLFAFVLGITSQAVVVFGQEAAKVNRSDDIADINSADLRVGDDEKKRFFLIGPKQGVTPPPDGFRLLLVMPGGPGTADFLPFVKRIYKHALPDQYLVAQLVAVKWVPDQEVVWPTKMNSVTEQKFSTEEFLAGVIESVKAKHKLDSRHIFSLSWSSSGPAAYSASLVEKSPITGSYVAMSVFKPNLLPPLENAKGHRYYLRHSPEDRVCPYHMAEQARDALKEKGAKVQLSTYAGGHGWRGDVFGNIRQGITWLENPTEPQPSATKPAPAKTNSQQPVGTLPIRDGFETGDAAPEGWQKGAAVPGVEYIWDKKMASEGKASLSLKKSEQRFFPIAEWRRTFAHDEKASKLNVSAQVKAEKASKAIIDAKFLDADNKMISHEWVAYIGSKKQGDPPADHDWKEYSGTVSVPAGTKQIVIGLQIYGPGSVWFDDLSAALE